jgi:hypothetical protein
MFDAEYAGDRDDRVCTAGFVLQGYGRAAVRGCKKLTATLTSTVEADFTAASHAVKEAAS